jgi:serine/threonine protein kinase/Tol biopolymer transport system component/tetratricopeptide (TPR) repeat protein
MGTENQSPEEILQKAAEIVNPAERAMYLKQVCGGDETLRAEIESLLRAHEEAGTFLDSPALDPGVTLDASSLTEGPGTVIGRYKLLEKIGEGGMAIVYMAEQTEPIRRKVALKVIKLGMDTKNVIARFEAERQALALMDHPNVAKIFDGGTTDTGRSYFVMELVRGVSITDYCDANRLSPRERLELFVQVCHAVQHAHHKGIIHRDLKPSNVMVTLHDGRPVPKIIDFGIAKATNQRLTGKTLFTRYAQIIGTPEYMSPEQAQMSGLDVDTRTDIYALGVLLYELLTGTTPFGEEELRRAGYLEMQRVIREQEPVKPSTKLSTLGETLTDIAKHRNSTPDLLRRTIRGDLDWIVMKSLEKDRVRRYETASGLAEDIRRHLEHEPILARGPGIAYRLERSLRKHRSGVLAALALGVLAGAATVVLSLWNQDRLRLVGTEALRDKDVLSQAREQYAKGERQGALETIESIFQSKHVGGDAQLLCASILTEDGRSEEALAILGRLVKDRREIAGVAHSLWARILWDGGSLEAEKLKEIEEHRRQAETLLPETPEAYFLQATAALTVKEQLAVLNKALELDSKHYESLRLRAFTYYASRKYDRMRDDALGMTYLRPGDSLGYSLRAIALRELGKYTDALAEYDRALARTPKAHPQYLNLLAQRLETLLRMGSYDRVIAEAQAYTSQAGTRDSSPLQYRVFCALTALGDYDQAAALFRQIISLSPQSRGPFQGWFKKYTFDALEAGRSWHPGDHAPAGAAFLPMVEAEETYRILSAKARRLTTDGFSAQWSPDGKKLAFSLGRSGNSGVATFDPATGDTDLLIVPGKDPTWSPDGRYIAFVRDCQALRVPEFVAAGGQGRFRSRIEEEVWIMKSDGTEPRRLAAGGWPSWDRDPTRVYFHSRVDQAFCSVSITDPTAPSKRIMACASLFPSIAPHGQHVAYQEGASFTIKELPSQKVVAQWSIPFDTEARARWSSAGDELCVGAPGSRGGQWIYHLDGREPRKLWGGQIATYTGAREGSKFVFPLATPYFEIWTAELDPKVSTLEALGPGQTVEEHAQELIALLTRRIEADPEDAYAYFHRAKYYNFLPDRAKADADLRRSSALANRGLSSDFRLNQPWTLVGAASGPFGYQLVVFVERQEDGLQVLRTAFGQKARGEMKWWEIPMIAASLVNLCFLPGVDTPPARANFTFGPAVNLGAPVNTSYGEGTPRLSPDGREMYITSDRPGGCGGRGEMWVARRASLEDDWGTPNNLGPQVNSSGWENSGMISTDGLTLYFDSVRPGGHGGGDLYMATRSTREAPWGPAINLGPVVNSSAGEEVPVVSADGLELFFDSGRGGGVFGGQDLWVSTRASVSDPWGPPVNLGPTINSIVHEVMGCLSPDGLALFFNSLRPRAGDYDTWMTTRPFKGAPWRAPVHLDESFNTTRCEWTSGISPDGRYLYFDDSHDPRPGGAGKSDIWQVSILPIVDFNGDGKVNAADMAILEADWGKSQSRCDIGPFPWGDGVVDENDLRAFMESLMTPGPRASDVPCDVVLSWISPSVAQAQDVYLGTSFEAVNNASRTNPQRVLVSQGQTTTAYNSASSLEFGRTYYWRVDFVIAGPVPLIYKGPVLKFTTRQTSAPK